MPAAPGGEHPLPRGSPWPPRIRGERWSSSGGGASCARGPLESAGSAGQLWAAATGRRAALKRKRPRWGPHRPETRSNAASHCRRRLALAVCVRSGSRQVIRTGTAKTAQQSGPQGEGSGERGAPAWFSTALTRAPSPGGSAWAALPPARLPVPVAPRLAARPPTVMFARQSIKCLLSWPVILGDGRVAGTTLWRPDGRST